MASLLGPTTRSLHFGRATSLIAAVASTQNGAASRLSKQTQQTCEVARLVSTGPTVARVDFLSNTSSGRSWLHMPRLLPHVAAASSDRSRGYSKLYETVAMLRLRSSQTAAPGSTATAPSHSSGSSGSPPWLSSFRLLMLPSLLFNRSSSPFRSRARSSSSAGFTSGGGPPRRTPHETGSSRRLPSFLYPLILRLNRIPSNRLLNLLIALNALVFLLWTYAQFSLERYRDPRSLLFMMRNFLAGETNLSAGRWWTLITSCVSHSSTNHFLLNMVSLFFVAAPVMSAAGNATFLALYFGAGLASAAFSLAWHRFADPWFNRGGRGTKGYSLGASGSVYAIMSCFACIQPRATFLLFFVLPVPAWLCVSGIFAWDLYSASMTPAGQVDGAGHVGGILAGMLFWRFGLKGVRM